MGLTHPLPSLAAVNFLDTSKSTYRKKQSFLLNEELYHLSSQNYLQGLEKSSVGENKGLSLILTIRFFKKKKGARSGGAHQRTPNWEMETAHQLTSLAELQNPKSHCHCGDSVLKNSRLYLSRHKIKLWLPHIHVHARTYMHIRACAYTSKHADTSIHTCTPHIQASMHTQAYTHAHTYAHG